MKLRNKKTGEIGWLYCDHISAPKKMTVFSEDRNLSASHWDYTSLAKLNEDWEDAPEEPKEYWYIGSSGLVHKEQTNLHSEAREAIGNRFGSPEEAEKAVEKLKAWKRLKDKGFRFSDFYYTELCDYARINIKATMINDSINDDLNLLF